MACEEVVKSYCQRASANKKHIIDYAPGLTNGETIVSVTPVSSPSGLTLTGDLTSPVYTAFVSGGTVGTKYQAKFPGTSSHGQVIPVVIEIEIIPD